MIILILFATIQGIICTYDRRIITSLNHSKYRSNVATTTVNGEAAELSQVSYLVSLKEPIYKIQKAHVWKNICVGSIIDSKRVLTAAHCFEINNYAHHLTKLRCVAGDLRNSLKHTGRSETSLISQWRKLIEVILHSGYIFPANDIALVLIDFPWQFNKYVQPIELSSRPLDYARYCNTAGYGRLGTNLRDTIKPVILVAKVDILPRTHCSLLWEMNMNGFICSDTTISNIDRGDSGGPLVCNGSSDPREKRGPLLVGIVGGKTYHNTTLYTRVTEFRSWIDRYNQAAKMNCNILLLIILIFLIYMLFYLA